MNIDIHVHVCMVCTISCLAFYSVKDVFDLKPQDHTQLISVLKQTELAGKVTWSKVNITCIRKILIKSHSQFSISPILIPMSQPHSYFPSLFQYLHVHVSYISFSGTISLLYALLLHDGPPRHSSVPPVLPSYILSITAAAIRTINNSSIVSLKVVQVSYELLIQSVCSCTCS